MGMLKDIFVQSLKNRTVIFQLSRSDYFKLQMICDSLNEKLSTEHEITPDMIATRVVETFIQDSFEDSTNRIVKKVLPDSRNRKIIR